MKKVLALTLLAGFLSTNTASAVYFNQTPTAGNHNFYPIMQHQMEKQETLDFVNNPEQYKKRREQKDAQLDYIEGKTNTYPSSKPTINRTNLPVNMQFSTGSDGQLKIQEIK